MAKQTTTDNAVENTPANEQPIIETPAIDAEVTINTDAPIHIEAPVLMNEMNFTDLVNKSANLGKLEPVLTLTAEYIELQKPSEYFDGIYIGQQDMNVVDKGTGEQKTLIACRFLIDKKVKINAGAVLLGEINRAKIQLGTPIRVTYTAKNGNTKLYEIALLG
jgi:hypothetical protein